MRQLGYKVAACVPGDINSETAFVLDYFSVQSPPILDNAIGERLILMDHSEIAQAVNGVHDAIILQIIDHHGIGNITVSSPLFINTMPVGATCTVVYSMFKDLGIPIPSTYAGLMLSAILSDTKNLTSSTTTQLDVIACSELIPLSHISGVNEYYQQMQDVASSYDGMSDVEIFTSDYKDYDGLSGHNIGVACVNSRNSNHDDLCSRMYAVMPQILDDMGRDMVFAIVSNVEEEYVDILFFGEQAQQVAEMAFGPAQNNRIRIPSLISRKKDFIPRITEALQMMSEASASAPFSKFHL